MLPQPYNNLDTLVAFVLKGKKGESNNTLNKILIRMQSANNNVYSQT
jgi:hypothetical protein